MHLPRPAILLSALLLSLAPVSALAQDLVIEESEEPTLIVLSAESGSVEDGTLILRGVPSVIYSSDRSARIAGPRSVEDFVAASDQGDHSFVADPPSAVLSVLDAAQPGAGSTVQLDSVIELTSVELDGDAVRFGFTVLEGDPPEGTFGPASLVIDRRQASVPITRSGSEDRGEFVSGPVRVDIRRLLCRVVVSDPECDRLPTYGP